MDDRAHRKLGQESFHGGTEVTLRGLLACLALFFPLSEVAMAILKRARGGSATPEDRGSMRLLWLVIMTAVGLAVATASYGPTRMTLPAGVADDTALALLGGGLALRWWAIGTLGRFFTTNIAIHDDHRVVDAGPYRLVRHPSYAGLLLAFAGLGFCVHNWLGLALLLLLITPALLRRIHLEEAALLRGLGPPYAGYCARTRRLIPLLY